VGLSVSVGALAFLREHDEEGAAWMGHDLVRINLLLEANGLPAHVEPVELPEMNSRARLSGFPYSWLHHLLRALAYARQAPEEFAPVAEGEQAHEDDRLDSEYDMGSHLICHSATEGFFVPIDFPAPLVDHEDALTGAVLGSSQQALAEVIQTAPLLGIELVNGEPTKTIIDTIHKEEFGTHPLYVERQVWLCLYEKFRLSVEYKTAVVFG
jgi:hypothetical protein